MAFSQELYEQAKAEINKHRAQAEMEAERKREAYKKRNPEYARITAELSATSGELVKRIFSFGGDDVSIDDIRERNLTLQMRAVELLAADGLAPDAFSPAYSCPACSDTGVKDGETCECVSRAMKKLAYEKLNKATPLELCSFDSFSLEHYPETPLAGTPLTVRRQMERMYNYCRKYAEEFSIGSQSLLMQGGVGLGKTHLSLAIAGRVIERGFNVVYGSAQELFTRVESEKFGRDRSGDTLSLLKECDLLIIDDLGAEFSTSFTVSVMYDILNTRMQRSLPTIVSTNLGFELLTQRYDERIVSRLGSSFRRLLFAGRDLRVILRKKNADDSSD